MWSFGKVMCQACGQTFPKGEMKLSPRQRNFGVCRGCMERWQSQGRRCVRCEEEVKPNHQVAFFLAPKGLGHFDCGGTLV